MRKALSLIGLLAILVAVVCLWEYTQKGRVDFICAANMRNVLTWVGLFGILSLGQAFVIITGGIDLSVGSIVGLVGISAALLLDKGNGYSPFLVIPGMLALGALIGTWHGVLITKARMQPFVVTLCGLFFYRGIARYTAKDWTQGFGSAYPDLTWLGNGFIPNENAFLPTPFLIFLILAFIVGMYLHFTAQGRHLFALGANEEAARFRACRCSAPG